MTSREGVFDLMSQDRALLAGAAAALPEMVRRALARGADPRARDQGGRSALMLACMSDGAGRGPSRAWTFWRDSRTRGRWIRQAAGYSIGRRRVPGRMIPWPAGFWMWRGGCWKGGDQNLRTRAGMHPLVTAVAAGSRAMTGFLLPMADLVSDGPGGVPLLVEAGMAVRGGFGPLARGADGRVSAAALECFSMAMRASPREAIAKTLWVLDGSVRETDAWLLEVMVAELEKRSLDESSGDGSEMAGVPGVSL